LKKYIAFARRIRPKVSRKAAERIKEYYLTLRMQTPQSEAMYEGEAPIPITPRQLEALIRLAEAHAKMLLKETVDIEDAEAAIELMNYMLKTVAYDVSIGGIDIHMLSGYRHSKMLVSDIIMEKARELSKGKEEGVSRVELIKAVMEELNVKRIRYTEKMVKELIDELRETGNLYMPKAGYFKPAEES
ncbi:MAG TPA: minichromosome maintenance protein MCM, partial [Candidatus Bathyarchaeota archaeon]|nr:minichromosome maintenance protein MCM [Candidatus Bathyarchaeota archaeon]